MEEIENNTTPDTVEQPYDPAFLDNIKRILEMQQKGGRTQTYEIEVDGLHIVQRTPVLEVFDNYKTFVHDATRKIIVTIYRGVKTPACTKHIFIKEKQTEKENLGSTQQTQIPQPGFLSGIEVKQMMQDMLEKDRMNMRILQMEKELDTETKKVQEAETYISKLQTGIQLLKEKADSKQAAYIDRFLKFAENPPDWLKLYMAGGMKPDPRQLEGSEILESEVIVRKKQKEESLTEEQKEFLLLMQNMEEKLSEDNYGLLMIINDKLLEESTLIPQVADLIEVKILE